MDKPLLDVIAAHLAKRPGRDESRSSSKPGFYADVASRRSSQSSCSPANMSASILFCGTGIGMSISANKVPGVAHQITKDFSRASGEIQQRADHHQMGAHVMQPKSLRRFRPAWSAMARSSEARLCHWSQEASSRAAAERRPRRFEIEGWTREASTAFIVFTLEVGRGRPVSAGQPVWASSAPFLL